MAGSRNIQLRFGSKLYPTRMLVAEALTTDLILGRDFLKQHKCTVELGEENLLHLTQEGVTLPLGSSEKGQGIASVAVAVDEAFCVPPLSEMEIMGRVPQIGTSSTPTWLVKPNLAGKRSALAVAS